jgi:hypothetical protein
MWVRMTLRKGKRWATRPSTETQMISAKMATEVSILAVLVTSGPAIGPATCLRA